MVSLGANIAIAVAKLVGAFMTGSGSMLAEALHSVADSGNEALLLWGRREAKQRPSALHPLGRGRATYFWSFIVALLLFSMGGVASIYEGIRKFSAGEPVQSPWVAIGILAFAAVAEGISLYVALKQINRARGSGVCGTGSGRRGEASSSSCSAKMPPHSQGSASRSSRSCSRGRRRLRSGAEGTLSGGSLDLHRTEPRNVAAGTAEVRWSAKTPYRPTALHVRSLSTTASPTPSSARSRIGEEQADRARHQG